MPGEVPERFKEAQNRRANERNLKKTETLLFKAKCVEDIKKIHKGKWKNISQQ